jgi:ribA/ribD-fused uncharacterized protein
MMYRKAKMFNSHDIAEAILLTDNPKEQKDLGRLVPKYDETIWAEKRVDIMVEGLYEKFNQNTKLRDALLNTGDTIIAEASPVDKIWGIGLAEDHPDALDQSKWRGQNLLGITLMQVRDKINQNWINSLGKGTVAEDKVLPWLKSVYNYVVDFRYQKHDENKGPSLEGTSGRVVLPDFYVLSKFEGRILIDVKSKDSIYPINGKQYFTVDDYRLHAYKKAVELLGADKLQLVFVYRDEKYFYDGDDHSGTYTFNNGYGYAAYIYEHNRAKIRK